MATTAESLAPGAYRHSYVSSVVQLDPIDAQRVAFVLGDGKRVVAEVVGDQLRLRTDGGRAVLTLEVSNVLRVAVGE